MCTEPSVGRLIVTGLDGRGLDPIAAALERGELGGLIVFREDLGSVEETRALISRARELSPHPLLVTVDEEGGLVSQLDGLPIVPGGTDRLSMAPAPAALGEIDDVALTERVYHVVGRALRDIGIDIAFAPLLDVNVRDDNPVIGRRSFGSAPDLVARHARAALRGLEAGGVVGCPKHFPGHGATVADSHHALPVVPGDRQEIERRDLSPYRAVFADHVPLVMSAHVQVPALDPSSGPATRSARILTDLLRGRLGFRGAVVSDALEMAGFGGDEGPGAGVDAALRAGVDLFLRARGAGAVGEIRAALETARGTSGGLHGVERALGAVDALTTWIGFVGQRARPAPPLDLAGVHERATRVVRPPAPPGGPTTFWLPDHAPEFVLREEAVRAGLSGVSGRSGPGEIEIRRYGPDSLPDPDGDPNADPNERQENGCQAAGRPTDGHHEDGRQTAGRPTDGHHEDGRQVGGPRTSVLVLYVRGSTPTAAERDGLARLERWRAGAGPGEPPRHVLAVAVADHVALREVPLGWGAIGTSGCHESAFEALGRVWSRG